MFEAIVAILFVLTPVIMVIGLIRPHWLRLPDRKSVFLYTGSVFFVLTILVVGFSSPEKPAREVVYNSSFDGSVMQVERYLEANLKDPDSLDVIEWGQVVKIGDEFLVRCKYRAKNSFGGYVITHQAYTLVASGAVINVADW